LRNLTDWIDVDEGGRCALPAAEVEHWSPGREDGTYRVSLDYPEINPFMERARNRASRETLFRKNWNRAVDANRPLLAEALELRQQIADLLGFPTWAGYAMEVKMAADPGRVRDFYRELVPPLEAAAREEIEVMRGLHREAAGNDTLQAWDWAFYDTRVSVGDAGVDAQHVRE